MKRHNYLVSLLVYFVIGVVKCAPLIDDITDYPSISEPEKVPLKFCQDFRNEQFQFTLIGRISVFTKLRPEKSYENHFFLFSKLDQRFKAFGHEIQSFILTNTSDDTGLVSLPTSGNVRVLRCSDTGNICDHFDYQSVYIFDKCGRFTFVIIYPWSSVRQPYVKAGLLSTIFDAPCGSCHINASEFDISKLIANETKSFKLTVLETGPFDDDEVSSTMNREVNTDDFKIPIKIYLPLEHAHPIDDANITYMKYNYVVLKNDDPNYHEHSDTDTIEVIQLNEVIDGFDTNETKWIFNSLNDSTVTYEGKKVHNDYVEVKQHNDIEISSLFDEPTTELIANSEDPDTEPMEDMRVNMEHLQKLIPWVRYKI